MPEYKWASRAEPHIHPEEAAIDAEPGPKLTRRRFVALALYTSAGVVLSHRLSGRAAAAEPVPSGAGAGLVTPPTGAIRLPLPCAPTETAWFEPPDEAVAIIEPEDLIAEHLRHRGADAP